MGCFGRAANVNRSENLDPTRVATTPKFVRNPRSHINLVPENTLTAASNLRAVSENLARQ